MYLIVVSICKEKQWFQKNLTPPIQGKSAVLPPCRNTLVFMDYKVYIRGKCLVIYSYWNAETNYKTIYKKKKKTINIFLGNLPKLGTTSSESCDCCLFYQIIGRYLSTFH